MLCDPLFSFSPLHKKKPTKCFKGGKEGESLASRLYIWFVMVHISMIVVEVILEASGEG